MSRQIPCVLRLHESKRRRKTTSLFILSAYYTIHGELHRHSTEDSIKIYHYNLEVIVGTKCKTFPFTQANELIEEDLTSVDTTAYRLVHIGDKILQSTETRQCIRSLHEELRKVFDVIAHILHQFLRDGIPTPPLFIVQGEAGTGKTKHINTVINYVSSILAGGGS